MVTPRVSDGAGRHSIAYSRVRPASSRTPSWLWPGAKSTTCEEWPACGGSTSVGTTEASASAGEKSCTCANGVLSTVRCGRGQAGMRRSVMLLHHRTPRSTRSSGVEPCAVALLQTLREDRAISLTLAAVLLAALRASNAPGLGAATGARELRSVVLMWILPRRPVQGPVAQCDRYPTVTPELADGSVGARTRTFHS